MPKYQVDVDVIIKNQVSFTVDAETEEKAYQMVADGDVKPDDPDDEEFLQKSDDWDIRYVTNLDTEEVFEY